MTSSCQQGSALLSVLWLSAALSMIAFTVATTVRSETERTSTQVDSLRCYYLATAGIDRALLHVQWGVPFYKSPMPLMRFEFPSGETVVEMIPENAKLDINKAKAEDLMPVVEAVGASPPLAAQITAAILDWRGSAAGDSLTEFDQYYLSLKPSFRARHASFEEIEELLLVKGMTPDLFHGSYTRDEQGHLIALGGLKDCLSVYGAVNAFDMNTISPALMRGLGISPGAIAGILARRAIQPLRGAGDIADLNDGTPGFGRLGLTPTPIYTFRSTARLRMADGSYSDVQRSVSAMVRFLSLDYDPPYHILRWYDNAWSAQ